MRVNDWRDSFPMYVCMYVCMIYTVGYIAAIIVADAPLLPLLTLLLSIFYVQIRRRVSRQRALAKYRQFISGKFAGHGLDRDDGVGDKERERSRGR